MRRDKIAAIAAEPEMCGGVSNSASQQDELGEHKPPRIRLEAGPQLVQQPAGQMFVQWTHNDSDYKAPRRL